MRISVPGRRNQIVHRFAFRHDELEFTIGFQSNTQHRNRAGFDFEFHSGPGSRFTMILLQAANDRFAVGDIEMMRSVMANQHGIVGKVDRMELGKSCRRSPSGP